MYHAKETITEWLKDKDEKFQESFLTIVKDKVEFVWYKSDDTDPIKVFTRLNIGKIGLTESELIKALFLSSNNFGATETTESKLLTLVEIANEWDKIEYRLQDDRFWLFFHGTDYNKPTRIDYILDIAKETNEDLNNDYDGEMYPTFRYYYESFNGAPNKQAFLTDRWKSISRIYQILEEWYNDEELYHYIGFLCALEKDDKDGKVTEYIKTYLGLKKVRIKKGESEKQIMTKKDFILYLKYRIKDECGNALELDRQYEGYKQPQKREARPVLLLHNVQTVLDQNASIIEEKKYGLPDFIRFPFHLFKKELKEGVFEGKKDLRIAWYNNSYALYKKSAQNDKLCFDYSSDEYPEYLLLRNSLLSKLREVDGFSLGSDQIIVEDESYYYGDDVFLEYNNINYFWSSNDCIYTFDIDKGTKSKKNILEKASKINAYGIIDNLKTYNYS